jgi:hypothetical protein
MHKVLIAVLIASSAVSAAASETFDIVLKGGRVVDPETGLDGIRDVAIVSQQSRANHWSGAALSTSGVSWWPPGSLICISISRTRKRTD